MRIIKKMQRSENTHKRHGLAGKPSNAKKEENDKKMSFINMRIKAELKIACEKTAKESKMTLSAWITKLMIDNNKY